MVDTPVEAQLLIEDKALTLEQAVEDMQRIEGMECRKMVEALEDR